MNPGDAGNPANTQVSVLRRGVGMNRADMVSVSVGRRGMPSGSGMHLQAVAANESDIGQEAGIKALYSKNTRTTIFYLLVLLVLYTGWVYRGNVYITPEEGAGYALGIVGGTMMLLLMMYPMRKHMRWMRGLGPVHYWFRVHMLLGILGPVCILYHCNYQLGSTNGNVALFSMLLVAGSGLVGRYFYTQIHYGLYGRKADLAHLGSDAAITRRFIDWAFAASPEFRAGLLDLEKVAARPVQGFLAGMLRVLEIGIRTHWYWVTAGPVLRRAIKYSEWGGKLPARSRRSCYREARHYLRVYLVTVRKVAGLALYERLFSLWHHLHLPFFLMLLISGIVHVCAVHVY